MSFIIRPAVHSDAEAVGALTVEAYVGDGLIRRQDEYATFLADADGRIGSAEVFVAVADSGEVLGSVAYVEAGGALAEISRPGEAEMRSLAVAPSGRGHGVGEALARHCVQLARSRGIETFVLSSTTQMVAAHRLYERLGFVRDPERDWVPVPGRQLWAFRKDLNEDLRTD